MLNKKAQFGPDFIIAIVVVLIIGLGGVVFLQLFVGGLNMQGLLSILDSEHDQTCRNILMAMVEDEYSTTGEDVGNRPYFKNLAKFYEAEDAEGGFKSVRFEQKMNSLEGQIAQINFRPGRITHMHYFLTSTSNARNMRQEVTRKMDELGHYEYEYVGCSIPVLGIYEMGTAELYIRKEGVY